MGSLLQRMAAEPCENDTVGTCADEPLWKPGDYYGRAPDAPYSANQYCPPCRLRVALAEVVDKMQIVGTWLVEDVGHHTCGTGPEGHYGAHEPGCGLEPIVDLSTVPGFTSLAVS